MSVPSAPSMERPTAEPSDVMHESSSVDGSVETLLRVIKAFEGMHFRRRKILGSQLFQHQVD